MDEPTGPLEQPIDSRLLNSNAETVTEPQFGLIDMVEAFTALRHECRSQIKETRSLTEQLEKSTQRIQELESKLNLITSSDSANLATSSADSLTTELADQLASSLIEIDIQLSRAVEAVIAEDQRQQTKQRERSEAISESIAGLSRLSRWFAGPVIKALQQSEDDQPPSSSAIADGLTILLSKTRQALRDNGIKRIETHGKPFDGETMNSIGVFSAEGLPPGHITQQISPAYLKKGTIIKFAEVRVAPE